MIGIICALQYEAKLLIEHMQEKKEQIISGISYTQGRLNGQKIVVSVCGVGKVFAAICTQTMVLKFSPKLIINTGVAGAIHPSLKCGDIAIASGVVQHDMDTSPLGDPIGMISGINIVNFDCSPQRSVLFDIAKKHTNNVIAGTIASGDQFVASHDKKEFIQSNFNAVACDMEAGAIGHTCYINKTDFCVIRAISDSADGQAHLDYPSFCSIAANTAAQILTEFILNVDK